MTTLNPQHEIGGSANPYLARTPETTTSKNILSEISSELQIQLVDTDKVVETPPGTAINYNVNNPVTKLLKLIEKADLAAGREYYLLHSLQYLFPYSHLELWGPAGNDSKNLDPRLQDNKTDFQKQNIHDFLCTDTYLTRGWIVLDKQTIPFLRVSYRGGPDSLLSKQANNLLGSSIKAWIKVNGVEASEYLTLPYNINTHRYEVEIWGYKGGDLLNQLDDKGKKSLANGEILIRPDLIQGSLDDFNREKVNGLNMLEYLPNHAMHPILPLTVELAWTDFTEKFWDSKNQANYHYQFNMFIRGWNQFLTVGTSSNPHGGLGILRYRNLMSNYFQFENSHELQRTIKPWMFNSNGQKGSQTGSENFLKVDYVDLHLLEANCAIGIHRHRDNQEIFFLLEGSGIMVMGDWCKLHSRERCFEVRTMEAGSYSLLKPGNLHAFINPSDEKLSLLMFGGYD